MDPSADIERWVEVGLIDSNQAAAIVEFEAARAEPPGAGRGMEALAYLGSALILIALGLLLKEFWDEVAAWGRFFLALAMTLILLAAGSVLGRNRHPAAQRAKSFAWFLAVGSGVLTAITGIGDWANLASEDAALVASATALALGAALWVRSRTSLQLVATGIASAATVAAVVAKFDVSPNYRFGVGFFALGVAWLALTWRRILEPVRTGYAVAAILILLIAFPESTNMPWPLLGVGAGLGLVTASVQLDQAVLLGIGVAGLFVYIPMTVFELFGDSLGVPVALLITGLVLLGLVMLAARLRSDP